MICSQKPWRYGQTHKFKNNENTILRTQKIKEEKYSKEIIKINAFTFISRYLYKISRQEIKIHKTIYQVFLEKLQSKGCGCILLHKTSFRAFFSLFYIIMPRGKML